MANKKYEDDEFDIDFKEDDDIETPLDDNSEDSEDSIEEENVESEEDKAEESKKKEEEPEDDSNEEDSEEDEDPEEEEKERKRERKEKKEAKKEEKREHKKEKHEKKESKREEKNHFKHKNKHKHHEEKQKKHEEKKDYKVKIKKKTLYKGLIIAGIIILLIAAIVAAVKFWPKLSGGGNYGTAKLDFYVMSQCPYGVQVEDAIGPVLEKLGKSVDFSINFIATEKTDGTFSSLHGQPEVNEDIRQLCAIKYYPDTYMDYILCINKNYQNAETIWETCAKNNGVDAAKIKTCFDGTEGKTLLSASIKKATEIKATGSPTIYINDVKYSGARDSASFQKALCTKLSNHPECENMPKCVSDADCTEEAGKIGKCLNANTAEAKCEYTADARVNLVVLTDNRCTECDTDSVMKVNNQYFPNLVTRYVDYNTDEGKQLYSKYSLTYLPAYIFDKNVNNTARYAQLASFFDKKSDSSFVLKAAAVGSSFDPNAEICTNGVDDNGDGVVDCNDAKCKESLDCRTEVKKKIDLFIMSQCPYGTRALDSMREVLATFNGSISFNVNFIASENADGTFNSLHGQAEVEENIRELCAIKYYPTKYRYMDYIWCRDKDITSTEWESCAEDNGMDVSKIKTCSEGTEGKKLLSENIKIANALNIGASPTWMANNKYQFSGLDANTIKTNYCKYNPGLAGCEKTLNSTSTVSGSC